MKKIFLALMTIAGIATYAHAQTTYNMNVRLNDGTVVTYAADDVAEVTFEEAQEPFNILTEEHIPDANLRSYIQTEIANGAETYTNIHAAAYTGTINLKGKQIYNLQGIEFFTNLQELNCSGLNLQSLDVSALTNLRVLDCSKCKYLPTINLGQNDVLEDLNISDCTKLKGYDLTQLPSSLKSLKMSSMDYESIPFSQFPNLEILDANMNNLTELDLQGHTSIKEIALSSNNLTTVNLNGCSNLKYLLVSYNSDLSSLNIDGCNNIENLYIHRTKIVDVDLAPFSATLKELNVSHNGLTSLDVSQCTELTYLECQSNNLTQAMSFNNNTKLQELRIEENHIPSVDLTNCNELITLNCYSMDELTELILPEDQSHMTLLNAFSIPNVTSLNIGNMSSIAYLNVYVTGLTRIDISQCNKNAINIFLQYNDSLRQVKVWSDFDIDNPPTNVWIDDTAEYVYDFTD